MPMTVSAVTEVKNTDRRRGAANHREELAAATAALAVCSSRASCSSVIV